MVTYTKISATTFLRLEAESDGTYGYLLLDDSDSRLILEDNPGQGKFQPIFNKVAK
jgi:hypothetical protein